MLHVLGVVGDGEVISWADGWIGNLDRPGDALMALACSARDRYLLTRLLCDLSAGADYWCAFRTVCGHVEGFLREHPQHTEEIAELLDSWVCNRLGESPPDFAGLARFDDGFALARQGIYGQWEDVRQEFLAELHAISTSSAID